MKNNVSKIVLLVLLVIMIGLIGYLVFGYIKKLNENVQNPIVTMEIQDYGTVKMELYPDQAPNTVANFIKLIQNGYYDGLTFHRIDPSFMIQGGDVKGDGTGKVMLKDLYPETSDENDKEYTIPGEFIANNYTKNTIRFEKGVLALSRADYSRVDNSLRTAGYDSGAGQFFIMVQDKPSINGMYAAFGRVIEGMDIIENISKLETEVKTDDEGKETKTETPVNKPVITKMTVDTFGVDYGYPTTQDAFDYTSWIMSHYGSGLNLQ